MILVLDTSAFVKLLAHEEGSEVITRAAVDAERRIASRLVYVEARGFIGRRQAERSLSGTALAEVRSAFAAWWPTVDVVEFDSDLSLGAGEIAERHAIRGMDAVHLASALRVREGGGEEVIFATWDERLRAVARRERLATLPA